MYRLDPFTYLIEGLVSLSLQDVPVRCRDDEFNLFSPPSGQTCMEYAGKFADLVGGYIANPNATQDCQYCQYREGQNFFVGLWIEYSHVGRNIGILIAYTMFNILVLLLAARFLKWQKR
jgi:ABC-type multidrug transport system permease subunit